MLVPKLFLLQILNLGLEFREGGLDITLAVRPQAGRSCRDLFEDLRDGHNLLSLLEVLSGEILVTHKTNSFP